MSTQIEIQVPDIGDATDVPIVEIPIGVGDEIAKDDTIIVLETDKATLDVPSSHAGRITELKVSEGDTVSQGNVVLTLEVSDSPMSAPSDLEIKKEASPDLSEVEVNPSPELPTSGTEPIDTGPPRATAPGQPVYASPSVRKFARTLGVVIANVKGTGPKDRITREDVEAYVKAQLTEASSTPTASGWPGLPDWPVVDFEKFGPTARQPLSRIGKISGPSLARNAMVIPHVCNFDKADITDLEDFRKSLNAEARKGDAKLTMLAFTVKATTAALQAFPKFNSSLDGDELILKEYWNIGVAADTPEGLVVPVIKAADQKGLREISNEMADLAKAAREGKLKASDMQGATFTISSLGGIGGTGFTPIINAPEVAILGMTRAETQPVWDSTAFVPRLIQPLSLSWDHRAVDGVLAARFLAHIAKSLSDFRRISI